MPMPRSAAATVRRWLAIVPVLALAGCLDGTGVDMRAVALVIVPEFGELAVFADNANQLRIVLTRVSDSTVEADTTVPIDPVTGEAAANFQVQLPAGPEDFEVLLQAIRSSDGAVLFEGVETIMVSSGSSSEPVTIPVTYAGPTGDVCVISPSDTVVGVGQSFTFGATVYDTAGSVVGVPVTFGLVNPADSTILKVQKYTGLATADAANTGTVRVVAHSADGLTDTARVSVGAVPTGLRIQPGFEIVAAGGTVQLGADLIDADGVVIGPPNSVTWTSRSPSAASVSGDGLVTAGSAEATVRIVATSGSFSDSILVRVPAPGGDVPFTAIADGRSFARPQAGDTILVVVNADMAYAGGELLGSYNAELTWNQAILTFVDVQSGGFGTRTVNDTQTQQGSLRFSAADATGASGDVGVATIRFVAQGTGSAALQLAITEVSAAQTFTNLLSIRTVTVGSVTVRP
jgi:hypothetical protein